MGPTHLNQQSPDHASREVMPPQRGVKGVASYRPPARPRPRGAFKWGFNLPILLYRARLGWLLGHRFLLLTHRGRKTGRLHHTVLEVVRYDHRTQESAVLSAYGKGADWYQNILAHPALEVCTGRSSYRPQQRLLDTEERLAALRIYQRRYRRAFQTVMRWLGYSYDGTEASLQALAESVVMVAFRPRVD
jgi:deazaflavin-dependent oxidoreductase (nitroreductase family)